VMAAAKPVVSTTVFEPPPAMTPRIIPRMFHQLVMAAEDDVAQPVGLAVMFGVPPYPPGSGLAGTVASAHHCERAGWADASLPCLSVRIEVWLRWLSLPTGCDHSGGPLVPALCAVVQGC